MSYRKFVNFLIFIISILIVNLVTTLISDYLMRYKHMTHPVKATLIGMVAVVFILYPAFNWIDDWSEKLSKKMFAAGKNAGGKFFGLLWAFSIAFTILFLCYLNLWFSIKPWNLL
jgi:hypothetical protein